MLHKVLLGLCLVPVLAHAEIACLEGPAGGKCHNVDINGEVFKTATPSSTNIPVVTTAAAAPKTSTATPNKRVSVVIHPKQQQTTANKVAQNDGTRQMSITEQRVRQRAQLMKQRFMRRQGMANLAASNDNDSLIKRKQAAAELRHRVETQQ